MSTEEAEALGAQEARDKKLICSGCGQRVDAIHEICQREVRDLPVFEFRTTVVIELYRVRCPQCSPKIERVDQLLSKAPFSRRFEEAVGLARRESLSEAGGACVPAFREYGPAHRSA